MASGVANSEATTMSVSSSRPSASYRRTGSPRRRAARVASRGFTLRATRVPISGMGCKPKTSCWGWPRCRAGQDEEKTGDEELGEEEELECRPDYAAVAGSE